MALLNLEIEQKLAGGYKPTDPPTHAQEVIALLMNYKNQYKKKYTEDEFYQHISDWMAKAPKNIFYELSGRKTKEVKKLIELHLGQHVQRYQKSFKPDMLNAKHTFYISTKSPNAAFIKKQLQKINIPTTDNLKKKATHGLFVLNTSYPENMIVINGEELFQYLKKETPVKTSPYQPNQHEKINTLLLSHNMDSIDLGFTLISDLDEIPQDVVAAMAGAYYLKKIFKKGHKNLVKNALEYHFKHKDATKHIRSIMNGQQMANVVTSLIKNGIDVTSLIGYLFKNKGKEDFICSEWFGFDFYSENRLTLQTPDYFSPLTSFKDQLTQVKSLILENDTPTIWAKNGLNNFIQYLPNLEEIITINYNYDRYFLSEFTYQLSKSGDLSSVHSVDFELHNAKTDDFYLQGLTEIAHHPNLKNIHFNLEGTYLTFKGLSKAFFKTLLASLQQTSITELYITSENGKKKRELIRLPEPLTIDQLSKFFQDYFSY